DANGLNARFSNPQGITGDSNNLYVADTSNATVRKMVRSSGTVSTLAGTPGSFGSTDGTGAGALFNAPVAAWSDGVNVYVSDSDNGNIRKIVIASGQVTTVATNAALTAAGVNAARPEGIFGDGQGNLFVADAANNTVLKIIIATGQI